MNDLKPILAIETSDVLCGCALYFSEEHFYSTSLVLKNSHSSKLFSLIEYILKESRIDPQELDSVAVSEGPGSFTGLRIGMSAAKGIAVGAGLPIVPVPTFEAFAFQLSQFLNDGTNFIIANRVNKNEVYYARFQVDSNNYIFVEQLTILNNTDFIRKSTNIKTFGNAASILGEPVSERKTPSAPAPEFVASWARNFGMNRKTSNYDYLEPNYLKNFHIKEKKQ